MGKSVTPKYRLRVFDRNSSWIVSWQGKPTDKRLAEYIETYTASLKTGGANQHISQSLGFIPVPYKAQIERNTREGQIVATWQAPAFWAF